MIKDKKVFFYKSFFALIIIFIFVSVIAMFGSSNEDFSIKMGYYEEFNSDWYCENTKETFDRPYTVKGIEAGEELVISKKLPENMDKINCLEFRNYQGACKVYIDGELRQEYDDAPYRKFSKFPPSAELFLDLTEEDAGKTIVIKIYCENTNYVGLVSGAAIGEKDTIIRRFVNRYTPMILIAILLIVFGLICVIVFYLLYRESKKNKYVVYLGMFLAIMGLWIFMSSRLRQLFFGNITAVQYLELWLVHVIPIPFVFFCDLRCGGRYRRFSNIILTICYLNFVIINVLHFAGICDKAYSLTSGHICCAITAAYFIICNIREYRTGYKKESTQICIAFLFLAAFGFLDIFNLYINRQWIIGIFISIGVLCFSFIILAFSIQDYIAESRTRMAIIAESEAKEQFFATMSHDIRTPINAIIGMNEMIQREAKDASTLEYSRDIERASETLMSIVNNILDFSKIRDGKYEIVKSQFLFAPMVADIIKMTSTLAENKGLKFITTIDENIPTGIIGDENALKRILTNLTSNAIKYTKEGSVEFIAKLTDKAESPDNIAICFEIKDTGIGIKKDDIPHIFDVFSRMDGEKNKSIQGTGLGLAITSALASSMGSEIIVSSVYGEGSTFSVNIEFSVYDKKPIGEFTLESAKSVDAENKKKVDNENDKDTFFDETKTLLVVDDTAMNLKVMTKLLKYNGVKVVTATSGDECIKHAKKERFDLILLDDMMPNKDGRETLTELRNSNAESIKGVPVIVLTANAGPGVRDMYLSLGFTDYLSKPVSTESLNNILWKYLGNK